jgi:hypothetical protein
MEKEFIPMDLALRMKALGFDEPCMGFRYIEKNKPEESPTFSQAFRFFREKYGLFAEITLWGDGLGYTSMIKEIKQEEFIEVYQRAIVDTGLPIWKYEKAELACLKKILEIVENIK